MIILGINDGHNGSASLSENGKIVFALSEERITRIKNFWGYPSETISHIFNNVKNKSSIDYFGIYRDSGGDFLVWRWAEPKKGDGFIIKKFIKPLIRRFGGNYIKYLSLVVSKKMMKNYYADLLGVNASKIFLVNHHMCHAESAIFSLDKSKDWLVFTVDAEGDQESGAVYRFKDNIVEKLTSIPRESSLGYFYTWITELLGMKPNQHEFKVMGLEPYVRKDTEQYERVYRKISALFFFEDINYKSKISMVSKKYKKWLKVNLFQERFDNIAAATQKTFEFVTQRWIKNWIKKEEIYNVALSGGSFMNVKGCQKILELDEVDDVYVMPSSGDETTVLGVCNYINRLKTGKNLEELEHLYYGIDWSNEHLIEWSQSINTEFYNIDYLDESINSKVAELLSQGNVVARFDGRDEFGARALGNRSILAHPSNSKTIAEINKLIKDRDFWMPFTPSILKEDSGIYINNNKNISSPFMAITFDSTKQGERDFSAAIHPYDKTMRIQMVTSETNMNYYNLLKNFKELTGISGLLNTSFNLHGEPNVHTPSDALRTLDKSGLKYLAIGSVLITKK